MISATQKRNRTVCMRLASALCSRIRRSARLLLQQACVLANAEHVKELLKLRETSRIELRRSKARWAFTFHIGARIIAPFLWQHYVRRFGV